MRIVFDDKSFKEKIRDKLLNDKKYKDNINSNLEKLMVSANSELSSEIAEKFISCLRKAILESISEDHYNGGISNDIAITLADSLDNLPTKSLGGLSFAIPVYFNTELSRNSLLITYGKRAGQRTGDGIDNIVVLLDKGYSASSEVYGLWESKNKNIASIQSREGAMFIERAIDDFMGNYAKQYNIMGIDVGNFFK